MHGNTWTLVKLVTITGLAAGTLVYGLISLPETANAQSCTYDTGSGNRSRPAISRPAYLGSYTDPAFGLRITRITGDKGASIPNVGGTWPQIARHHYSKTPAWNADGTLLHLNRVGISFFLDGTTYKVLYSRSPPSSHAKWDPAHAERMIYIRNNEVGYHYPKTNTSNVIKSFSGYSGCGLGAPGKEPMEAVPSNDGKRLVMVCQKSGSWVGFMYDIAADRKYADYGVNDYDHQSMSPLGDYIMQHNDGRATLLDLNGKQIANSSSPQMKHQDVVADESGKQYICGVSRNSSPFGQITCKGPFPSLAAKVLTPGHGVGLHVSGRMYKKPGWLIAGMSSEAGTYSGEVLMIKVDGSQVRRLAHHRRSSNPISTYYSENHPVASPDGSKVIFASNFGRSDFISAYVIDTCEKGGGSPVSGSTPGMCNAFHSGDVPPQGYGVAWNTQRLAPQPLLLNSNCQAESAVLSVGTGESNHYVYKSGYVYRGGWQPIVFSGTLVQGTTDWLAGDGAYTLAHPTSGVTFWVAYVCQWIPTESKVEMRLSRRGLYHPVLAAARGSAVIAPTWQKVAPLFESGAWYPLRRYSHGFGSARPL